MPLIQATKPRAFAKDPWQDVRNAVFAPVKGRASNARQRTTRLLAYFESLGRAARQGDVNAAEQQSKLMRYLDVKEKKEIINPPHLQEKRLAFEQRVAKQERLNKFLTPIMSVAYALTIDQLEKDSVRPQDGKPITPFSKPYFITEVEYGENVLQLLRQEASKRERQGGSSEVGYGKPPVANRWKKNQSGNPSGKSKVTDDHWDAFRSGLFRRVPVILDGRKTKLSSAAIVTAKVFELAIKGDFKARREVYKILVELDRKGLLSPPPREPKRSRGKTSDALASVGKAVGRIAMLTILENMQADVQRVYGPNRRFLADIRLEKQEALSELKAAVRAEKELA